VKLLALDTATEFCSAALWLDGQLRTREALAPRAHGELILPMIEQLLAEAALGLDGLDAIAFGRGPGAFTGVRLAAAVAQGLGFAAQLPLIPVSDLRALAAQALAAPGAPDRAVICQDARMNEVYWGCFERSAQAIRAFGEEALAAPAALMLPSGWVAPGVPLLAAGSGFVAYPALRAQLGGASTTVVEGLYPRAQEIARLAADDGLACAVAPEAALPVYLRDRVTAVAPPSRN